MAIVYVSEYATLALGGAAQISEEPALAEQAVSIGAASNPFQAGTRFIRVAPDAACSILVGPVGTVAATTNKRLAANSVEYFGVRSGQVVATVSNT
jgi:hypothetical protein